MSEQGEAQIQRGLKISKPSTSDAFYDLQESLDIRHMQRNRLKRALAKASSKTEKRRAYDDLRSNNINMKAIALALYEAYNSVRGE